MLGITKRKYLRILLTIFKWCRVAVWLVVLAVVSSVLYLHLAGLPDFVKSPLIRELRARGVDAQFQEMRLGWAHEILVENVSMGRVNEPLSPSLWAGWAEARLDLMELLHGRINVNSFRLQQGKVRVPAGGDAGQALLFENVELALKFLPGDAVRLQNGRAQVHGLAIHIEGALTNFSAISDWKISGKEPSNQGSAEKDWRASLRQFLGVADQIKFQTPPDLHLILTGDARLPDTLKTEIRLAAPVAQTPWGDMTNFICKVFCSKILNPGPEPFATVIVSADSVRTPWGEASRIGTRMTLTRGEHEPSMRGAVTFSATHAQAIWPGSKQNSARADRLEWDGVVQFNSTNLAVETGSGILRVRQAESPMGSMQQATISFNAAARHQSLNTNDAWGPWLVAAPWEFNWHVVSSGIKTPQLELASLNASGSWKAPVLAIEKIETKVPLGTVKASAQLDVLSRQVRTHIASEINPRRLASLLSTNSEDYFYKCKFEADPQVEVDLTAALPAWDDRQPRWAQRVLSTATGTGALSIGKCAYEDLQIDSIESSFSYCDGDWKIPRLHICGPDGDVFVEYSGRLDTLDFKLNLDTHVDIKALLTKLVDVSDYEDWLNETQLAHPPKIHAEVRGNWKQLNRLSATGTLEITNFVALGQPIGSFTTCVAYSNQVAELSNVQLQQGDQFAIAPLLKYDFSRNIMAFVDGTANFDVRRIFKSLDPILPQFLREIAFDAPVKGRVNGWVSMVDPEAVDMHFKLSGDHFRWTNVVNLRVDNIGGDVDWVGRIVNLTNVHGSLYGGGEAAGWAFFDWRALKGTETRFEATVENVDLNTLIHGLSGDPAKVEGKFSGTVAVQGNCKYPSSWHGEGKARVTDALLWDIPLFGVLSPLLNGINDGWGNSRAHEAYGDFILTNGVLRTENTVIKANVGLHLFYKGDANLERVDAKVEGRPFRGMPVFGKTISTLLSPVTKTLEWRIVGPLRNPAAKPAYPTGLLLDKTLHPFRTLRSLIPNFSPQSPAPVDTDSTGTFQ